MTHVQAASRGRRDLGGGSETGERLSRPLACGCSPPRPPPPGGTTSISAGALLLLNSPAMQRAVTLRPLEQPAAAAHVNVRAACHRWQRVQACRVVVYATSAPRPALSSRPAIQQLLKSQHALPASSHALLANPRQHASERPCMSPGTDDGRGAPVVTSVCSLQARKDSSQGQPPLCTQPGLQSEFQRPGTLHSSYLSALQATNRPFLPLKPYHVFFNFLFATAGLPHLRCSASLPACIRLN